MFMQSPVEFVKGEDSFFRTFDDVMFKILPIPVSLM